MSVFWRTHLHRYLVGILLLGNAVAFAGVDPISRAITALVVLVLVLDLRRAPLVPRLHQIACWLLAGLVLVQLTPLPEALRDILMPGFAGLVSPGWASLSVAPWATVRAAAGLAVALAIALTTARMAGTRSGLPALLGILAGCGALLAVIGLASEAGAPHSVMLVRANTVGGGTYGPFVNANHFAQAIELTIPAALVLLAAAMRQLRFPGEARRVATVLGLASAVAVVLGGAAMLRCSSRGGVLFLAAAAVITLPVWRRPRPSRRWPWLVVAALLVVAVVSMASTQLPQLEEGFKHLLTVEGVDGNTRWELWAGTWRLATRSPLLGSGLGTFRHAAGLDKPATGTAVLEQAHNDWLEWAATTGVLGCAILLVAVVGIALPLLPSHARRLRFEYRYPLAGAALALVTTGFHEVVGFGLQTPLNRYLLAAWVGLVWGVMATTSSSRRQGQGRRKQERESSGEDSAEPGNERGEGELGGADVRV